jgi:hypothetical protein
LGYIVPEQEQTVRSIQASVFSLMLFTCVRWVIFLFKNPSVAALVEAMEASI